MATDRLDILSPMRAPMKKGDKVVVFQSIAGNASIVGEKGVVYNIHKLVTGQIKVTVRMENSALYHLDEVEVEVIKS